MLALASMGWAIAQDVPAPPPMRGEASLEDTMKFIQDKLPSKVNYKIYRHDNVTGTDLSSEYTFEVRNVSADAGRCRIDVHWRLMINGDIKRDKNAWVSLKQVQQIVVMSNDRAYQQAAAKSGHPEWSFKLDPPIFKVIARQEGGENNFLFYDETLADRVSEALRHAVDLCGGGSQEPF
jgi:hypothetical protein